MQQTAYLILESGEIFTGQRFGAEGETDGEVVFNTAMTGYLETLSDPSYYGQIVVQTFPLIGNYGVIPADMESEKLHLRGYVVRHWCEAPSNFRSEGDLDAFLKKHGIVGLCGIDTRRLTKLVREQGVMNGCITSDPTVTPELLERLHAMRPTDGAVAAVSTGTRCELGPKDARWHVAVWDFGVKQGIERELIARGCRVSVFPHDAAAQDILQACPDGVVLSNGPGDPAEDAGLIERVREVMDRKLPTMGICLGHQLMALAQGARTEKLRYGHRGANQPVLELDTGHIYITSQNHGYAVVADTLPAHARESFSNANDHTCEGVAYLDRPAFSVQFHPEACAGPRDTATLFDRFIALLKEEK